jgi:uncharacterized membrane protein YidH (DUF202 family)
MISSNHGNVLIEEARLQTQALFWLGVWKRAALSLMAAGMVLAWWGIFLSTGIIRGVLGIAIAFTGGVAARIIRRGMVHGKKNVEQILKAAGLQHGEMRSLTDNK